MITIFYTRGKGRWLQHEVKYIGQDNIEKTILNLLNDIENLENGFAADTIDNSEIDRYWEWTLAIEEVTTELNHILA